MESSARIGDELNFDWLSNSNIGAVALAYLPHHFHLVRINYLRHRTARLHLVTGPVVRQGHTIKKYFDPATVFLDGYQSVHWGGDPHLLNIVGSGIHGQLCFVPLLLC